MRNLVLILTVALHALGTSPTCWADRPPATALLPDTTFLLLHVPDAQDLGERMQDTALVGMLRDEQVRPVIEQLYGSVSPSLAEMEERLGMSIEELLALPLGELAVGVVGMPGQRPAIAVLIESTDQKALDELLSRGKELLTKAGFVSSEEELSGVTVTLMTRTDGNVREIAQLRIDDTLIVTTNRAVMNAIAAAWKDSEEQGTIGEVDAYNAIMTRCQSQGKAQITFYVDPISFIRSATRGNVGAAAGLAFLPAIGLDGLQAIGGGIQMGEDEFDSVVHAHLLLDQPRSGVLEMLTFTNGPTTPENWVPADVGSYSTLNFGVIQAYTELSELVDSFRGEDAFEKFVDGRLSQQIGIKFTDDLLPAMTGRFTLTTWYEKPATLTSQANAIGIELKDASEFADTFGKVIDKFSEQTDERNFGGTKIYQWKNPRAEADPNVAGDGPKVAGDDAPKIEDEDAARERRRQQGQQRRRMGPEACAAIVGNYLIICNKASFVERAILADQGATDRLANELDYKLIAGKIKRQPGGEEACMVSFERPEEGMKFGYDLLHSKDVRERISSMSEDNPFFAALDKSLSENRFPPFEVIAKYLAPGGGVVTNEESGFHYLGFGLRRQKADE